MMLMDRLWRWLWRRPAPSAPLCIECGTTEATKRFGGFPMCAACHCRISGIYGYWKATGRMP